MRYDKKIEDMHLKDLGKRYFFELSGGQQQGVALAMELFVEPEILLLYEPFSVLEEHLRSFLLTRPWKIKINPKKIFLI